MLTTQDRRAALRFKRRVEQITPVLDLRVYGSRARGDATPESDLDIYVELEGITPGIREKISVVAWEVGLETDRLISTLVATRSQLEHGAMGANPIVGQIRKEGVQV